MSILNVQISSVGQEGVAPQTDRVETNDTVASVTTVGYLNGAVKQGFSFNQGDFALVSTRATPTGAAIAGTYRVAISGANTSLVAI